MTAPPRGSTPYETWVLTVRAWQVDPLLSLEDLPDLTDDTFTPATYQRLQRYLVEALDAVGERWLKGMTRALGGSVDMFEIGRDLVSLRAGLARQWQLASHRSLPDGLRGPLQDGVRRRADRAQDELERAVRSLLAEATSADRSHYERLLMTLRENSMRRVEQYHATQDGRMEVALPPASAPAAAQVSRIGDEQTTAGSVSGGRFAHRRLFHD